MMPTFEVRSIDIRVTDIDAAELIALSKDGEEVRLKIDASTFDMLAVRINKAITEHGQRDVESTRFDFRLNRISQGHAAILR